MTNQQVPSAEWDPPLSIPLFALQEVTGVLEEEIFHPGIQYNGPKRPLRPRRDVTPGTGSLKSNLSEQSRRARMLTHDSDT